MLLKWNNSSTMLIFLKNFLIDILKNILKTVVVVVIVINSLLVSFCRNQTSIKYGSDKIRFSSTKTILNAAKLNNMHFVCFSKIQLSKDY